MGGALSFLSPRVGGTNGGYIDQPVADRDYGSSQASNSSSSNESSDEEGPRYGATSLPHDDDLHRGEEILDRMNNHNNQGEGGGDGPQKQKQAGALFFFGRHEEGRRGGKQKRS